MKVAQSYSSMRGTDCSSCDIGGRLSLGPESAKLGKRSSRILVNAYYI